MVLEHKEVKKKKDQNSRPGTDGMWYMIDTM